MITAAAALSFGLGLWVAAERRLQDTVLCLVLLLLSLALKGMQI
jgi:hypothetical protein